MKIFKKYLIYTEIYDRGGVDTFIINLISELNKNNKYKFVLLCNKSYPGSRRIKESLKSNIKVKYHNLCIFQEVVSKIKYLKFLFPILRIIFFLLNCIKLYKIFKNKYLDYNLLVINGGYPGGDSCRAASISWYLSTKKKSIHNFHNLASKSSFFYFIQDYVIDLLVIASCKIFVTVSNAAKKSIQDRLAFKKTSKLIFIYNGIKLENKRKIFSHDFIQKNQILSHTRLILMLATYERRKGHEFILNVLKYLPDNVKLICAGFGNKDEVKNVLTIIKKFNLSERVILLNFISDIDSLLNLAEVIVVPSQEFESFGIMCLDAMKYKKPLVVTNVGGLPEVVIHGYNGYVVDKSNVKKFSYFINKLLSNKLLSKKIGSNGYSRFLKYFTSPIMAKNFEKIL